MQTYCAEHPAKCHRASNPFLYPSKTPGWVFFTGLVNFSQTKPQTCLGVIYDSASAFHGQRNYKCNFLFYVFGKFNQKREKYSERTWTAKLLHMFLCYSEYSPSILSTRQTWVRLQILALACYSPWEHWPPKSGVSSAHWLKRPFVSQPSMRAAPFTGLEIIRISQYILPVRTQDFSL